MVIARGEEAHDRIPGHRGGGAVRRAVVDHARIALGLLRAVLRIAHRIPASVRALMPLEPSQCGVHRTRNVGGPMAWWQLRITPKVFGAPAVRHAGWPRGCAARADGGYYALRAGIDAGQLARIAAGGNDLPAVLRLVNRGIRNADARIRLHHRIELDVRIGWRLFRRRAWRSMRRFRSGAHRERRIFDRLSVHDPVDAHRYEHQHDMTCAADEPAGPAPRSKLLCALAICGVESRA